MQTQCGGVMLARKVYVRLKPNCLAGFIVVMENEVLPWLRKQEGFMELITLAAPDGIEIQVLSVWDHEGSADDYANIGYPSGILNSLEPLLDGISYGRTFRVVSSSLGRSTLFRQSADGVDAGTAGTTASA
jgi:hypothetical protein